MRNVFSCKKKPLYEVLLEDLCVTLILVIAIGVLSWYTPIDVLDGIISFFVIFVSIFLRGRYPYKVVIDNTITSINYTWLFVDYQRKIQNADLFVEIKPHKSYTKLTIQSKRHFVDFYVLCSSNRYWSESDLQKMIIAFEDNSVKIVR